MEQLKMKDLTDLYTRLRHSGMSESEVLNLPIYIGDDDELNGCHCAWYCEPIDNNDKSEDMQYIVEMINERSGNIELKDKGVLIS